MSNAMFVRNYELRTPKMTMPLALRGLHHISRVTSRLEESIAFYRDVLGFAEIARPPFDFRGAWLANYGIQIHLIYQEPNADGPPPLNIRGNHIALATEDIAAVERSLEERGVRFTINFQAKNPNVKQLFFQDPDGHNIEIGQYPPV